MLTAPTAAADHVGVDPDRDPSPTAAGDDAPPAAPRPGPGGPAGLGTARPTFGDRLREMERHRAADVEARLLAARSLEREAADAGDVETRMRARLVVADMVHRTGDATGAARLALEVNAWAAADGRVAVLARSHLVLSSVFEGIGDASASLDHAVRAIDLLPDDAPRRDRGNHLLRLADALALAGSADDARRRYDEAAEAFAAVGDREREHNVLNNLTVLEYESGDAPAALAAANRLAAIAAHEMNPAYADTIARARFASGDTAGATRAVQLGLRLLDEQGDTQAATPAELHLVHAEVLLAEGRVDEAEAALDRCRAVCEARNLAGLRVAALGVRAEVLAARGDFRRAYEAHRAFHAASVALRSAQQDAAARARQALFETTEARREAQRFWRQARTDALTDLYNRRYVDEALPGLLAAAGAVAGPGAADPTVSPVGEPVVLAAAIVDVDHFKRINDTFTHAAGDEVLRRLASALAAVARPDAAPVAADRSFAARLGGEEFLVVLAGVTPRQAWERIEGARRAVAGLDWSGLLPGRSVTVSAGLALARPGDTQLSLLGRADRHLYEAKERGRDRVVADPPEPA